MKNIKKITLAALVVLVAVVLMPAVVSASNGSSGEGNITLNFENREGRQNPANSPPDPGPVPNYSSPPLLQLKTAMMLSDTENVGTFDMHFDVFERNLPAFDSFRVTNTGNLPFALALTDENQTLDPPGDPDFSELLVCFNQLCDLGVYVPDTLFIPPMPLSALLPGQSQVFTVGIKLAENADWNQWGGLGINSTVEIKALPAL